MTPADVLTSFLSAVDAPITSAIVWPDSINKNHPLQQVKLSTRFWPKEIAAHLNPIISSKEDGWLTKIYWYVIAATICVEDGTPLSKSMWPDVYSRYVEKQQKEFDAFEASTPSEVDLKPRPSIPVDEKGAPLYPIPDYYLLGEEFKRLFSNPQGELIAGVLFEKSMAYNDWKLSAVGKSSETTPSSQLSTENPSDVAAP